MFPSGPSYWHTLVQVNFQSKLTNYMDKQHKENQEALEDPDMELAF